MLRIRQPPLPVSNRSPQGLAPVFDTAPGSLGVLVMLRSMTPIQLDAHDPKGLALSYYRINGTLPPGVSMDATGVISGTPHPVAEDERWLFEVEVRNSLGLVARRQFALTVTKVGYVSPMPA